MCVCSFCFFFVFFYLIDFIFFVCLYSFIFCCFPGFEREEERQFETDEKGGGESLGGSGEGERT